jgi:hypothetical protein
MTTTGRFGLRYPTLTDAPDGPQLGEELATDTDAWLSRAWPCTSTTRPTGVPDGFLIWQTDTQQLLMRAGQTWVGAGTTPAGGGGGGPALGGLAEAQYSATVVQTLPNAADTVVAFGTEDETSTYVTRSVFREGHKFTVSAGYYLIAATVRYKPFQTGERYAGIMLTDGSRLGGNSSGTPSGPGTCHVSVPKRLDAGAALYVTAWQQVGSGLDLEASDGWVRLNICRLGD